jgi:hypothetical protein
MVPAATERLLGMISTVKATMHKIVGALADEAVGLRPPSEANLAYAALAEEGAKTGTEQQRRESDRKFISCSAARRGGRSRRTRSSPSQRVVSAC